jgi:hypothetical protein
VARRSARATGLLTLTRRLPIRRDDTLDNSSSRGAHLAAVWAEAKHVYSAPDDHPGAGSGRSERSARISRSDRTAADAARWRSAPDGAAKACAADGPDAI